MFALFYLLLSGLLVYVCARRATIIAPPTVWNIYIFVSLLVYEWAVVTGLSRKHSVFSAMPLDYVAVPYHSVFLFFLAMQLFAIATTIGLPKPRSWIIFDTSVVLRYAHILTGGTALLVMAGLWAVSAWHFAAIDRDVLWLNYDYKSIKDPDGIGASGIFARLYHFAFRFVGLIAMAASVIYIHRKAWLHFALSAGLVAYALMFLLADNSRWAPVYFACALVMNYIVSKRPFGALTWINLVLVFVTFAKVLSGRSDLKQGVSSIGDGFAGLSLAKVPMYLEGFMTNIFPAALNFANAVVIDGTHAFAYKIRAFSPFPGFMDNYQAIQEQFQIKLAPSVPMSAFGEAYSFGWMYMAVFLAACFVWLRTVTRLLLNKFDAPALFLAILSYYFVVKLGSYAIRLSWRLMLIVIIAGFILHQRRKIVAKREARQKSAIAMRRAMVDRQRLQPGDTPPGLVAR